VQIQSLIRRADSSADKNEKGKFFEIYEKNDGLADFMAKRIVKTLY
jgi:hypothetical protein